MKCDICSKKIETIFLDKILGTHIKDNNRRKKTVCFECQKNLKSKEEILKALQ